MERKSSAYLNSDDMFSTYAQKTYMENILCELAFNQFDKVVDDVRCRQYLGDKSNLIKKSLIVRVSLVLILLIFRTAKMY